MVNPSRGLLPSTNEPTPAEPSQPHNPHASSSMAMSTYGRLRKGLNRINYGRASESASKLAATSSETVIAGARPPPSLRAIETMEMTETRFTAGENAAIVPSLPPGKESPSLPRFENVDALDFKKFYQNMSSEDSTVALEQRNSIATEASESSSRRTGLTQESTVASSMTSRVESSVSLNVETMAQKTPPTKSVQTTDKSWRDEFSENIASSGSGASTIDNRLSAFYLNKALELADVSRWDDAHSILDKAMQHGYQRGVELKSLFQRQERGEIMGRAMDGIIHKSWEQAQKDMKKLEEMGYTEDVSELMIYKQDLQMQTHKQKLLDALKVENWGEASGNLQNLRDLGLPDSEQNDLARQIETAEINAHKAKFKLALSNRDWDAALNRIEFFSSLKHIANFELHKLEMEDSLKAARRIAQRDLFDTAIQRGQYDEAETILKTLVDTDKPYSDGPPEDINRAEEFYMLMAKRSSSLRMWEKAADYWNRVRWLLRDEDGSDHSGEPPDSTPGKIVARFKEAEAYMRAKKWDAASGMLHLIDKAKLVPSQRGTWTLMKTQHRFWKVMNMHGSGDGRPPIPHVFPELKAECQRAIQILSEVKPEPPELMIAIATMTEILKNAGEKLEAEAYESLIPKENLVFGYHQLSAQTSNSIIISGINFDPVTLEVLSSPDKVANVLEHHLRYGSNSEELLDILLSDKIVRHFNTLKNFGPPRNSPYSECLLAATCERGDFKTLKFLLDRGLIVATGAKRGYRAEENLVLPAAIKCADKEIVRFVLNQDWHPKNDISILVQAIGKHDVELCNLLFKHGWFKGIGALNDEVARSLLEQGGIKKQLVSTFPNVPAKPLLGDRVTFYPDTVLHYAIINKSEEIVGLLLRHGAGGGGRSLYALDWAVHYDLDNIVRILEAKGCKITQRGKSINRKNLKHYKGRLKVHDNVPTSINLPLQSDR